MSTLSTTIPATPMPNATGTETQLAPMVEALADLTALVDLVSEECTSIDTESDPDEDSVGWSDDGPLPMTFGHIRRANRAIGYLRSLHPAPATLADETLRALVEETGSRDAEDVADMARVGHSLLERIAGATKTGPLKDWAPMNDPAEIVIDLHNALDDAIARAEAAEAKLASRETEDERFARLWQAEQESDPNPIPDPNKRYASESERWAEGAAWNERHNARVRKVREAARAALSQPAPVVEDGTARDEVLRVVLAMHAIRDGEHGDVPQSVRGFINATLDTFPPAPEGQNAEASLREAIEKALRSITYPVSTEIQEGGYDLRPWKDIVYGVDLLFAATATAPAVPDGRTEEVEK